jgi:hypothetical protein
MTLLDSIQSREKEIEVSGYELPEALIKIREQGGWVPSMDPKRGRYILRVSWGKVREQENFLPGLK